MGSPAVRVSGLYKAFAVPGAGHATVKQTVLHPGGAAPRAVGALRDVSFEVARGEFFGVVGKNGGGKSTLLKCVSGIYRPDAGSVAVEGRLATLIELGAGFDPEMTVRDNATLNAVLLGLSPRQARARCDHMLEFAALEQFSGARLKNLSSGMVERLAFAVSLEVDADVLLFDEVLAVGDLAFRERCFEQFARLKSAGRTVIVVTHSMEEVQRFCDRALLLHHGAVIEIGDPDAVAADYRRLNARGDDLGAEVGSPVRVPAAGRSVTRPRTGLQRFAVLTWTLAIAEFRLKYAGARLSYLWAVLRPLIFFAILLGVFTQIGRFDQGVRNYPLYLLVTIMLWTYFSDATATSVRSIVRQTALLRKLALPTAVVPAAVVVRAMLDLAINLLAVLGFFLAAGVGPRWSWLALPLLVGVITMLVAGLSLGLSALYVAFRDVDQLWVVARQALFYGSPIFYVTAMVPNEDLRVVTLLNPLAACFTEARRVLIDPMAPSVATLAGPGAPWLALGVATAVLGLGLLAFRRAAPTLVERL